jgi:molecular chaperone GrpE
MTNNHSNHKKTDHQNDEPEAADLNDAVEAMNETGSVEAAVEAIETNWDLPVETAPEQRIASLEKELADTHDRHLRLQAEYQNYRKRVSKDIATARFLAMAESAMPFLQVCDYLNMAMAAAETSDNLDAIRQGLKMITGEYQKAMDELGIVKVNAVGEQFNPELHDALAHEASSDVPEGKVIKQWNCGYKLGERLLRPAKVVVSSGPEKAEDKQEG